MGTIDGGHSLTLTAGTLSAINSNTAINVSLGVVGGASPLGTLTIQSDNASGLALPAITLASGSNLSVTTNGAITQSGLITVPGTASFSAGANAITLTNTGNLFTGAVTLSNSGANDVSIINNKALVLAASTVGRNLFVTASGAISQTGALVVPGTASFMRWC